MFRFHWNCSIVAQCCCRPLKWLHIRFSCWIQIFDCTKISCEPRWALNLNYATTRWSLSVLTHFIYFRCVILTFANLFNRIIVLHLINFWPKVAPNIFGIFKIVAFYRWTDFVSFNTKMIAGALIISGKSHWAVQVTNFQLSKEQKKNLQFSIKICRWKIPLHSWNRNSANVWNANDVMGETERQRVTFPSRKCGVKWEHGIK